MSTDKQAVRAAEAFCRLHKIQRGSIFDDKGTPVMYMILIDAHNDEFYLDTKRVREWAEQQEQVADRIETLKYAVQDERLDIFTD